MITRRDSPLEKRVRQAVRNWVISIGSPRGCLSPGGLDEDSLVAFVMQQREDALRQMQRIGK